MPEVIESAVQSAEDQQQPVQPEGQGAPAPITQDQLNDLARNRDFGALQAMESKVFGNQDNGSFDPPPTSEEGQEPQAQEPATPDTPPQEPQAQQPTETGSNVWAGKYLNENFELPDSDGFLGIKDIDGLKKANALYTVQSL